MTIQAHRAIATPHAPARTPLLAPFQRVLPLAGVTLLVFCLAYGGIMLTRGEGRIAAVWVPNAVLAMIVLRARPAAAMQLLVAGFVGNVLADFQSGDGVLRAFGLSSVNAFEVLLLCGILRGLGIRAPDFATPRHIVGFAAAAVLSAAASGIPATLILHPATGAEGLQMWWKWARADALGLILFVPALAIILDALKGTRSVSRAKLLEAAAIIAFGTTVSVLTFWQSSYPFLFLDAPLVLLYALRLGSVGNAIAIINLAIVATYATWNGHGPISLVKGDLGEQLMVLQVFLASSFAVGLPFAALMTAKRESEERFRNLAEAAPLGIFEIAGNGHLTYMNSNGRAIVGEPEQSGGRADWARRLRAAAREDQDGPGGCTVNETFDGPDDRLIHTKIVFSSCGETRLPGERVIGVVADITREVEMAQELAATKRTFEVLADLSPAGIFRTDAIGTLLYVNRSWLALSGLDAEAARDDGWANAVHPDDVRGIYDGWFDAVYRKVAYRADFRFVHADGTIKWVEVMAAPELDEDGAVVGFVGVNVDITERKRAESKLLRERERAQQASQAKAEFLANMSHEIRTPMNGVLGFADLLRNEELNTDQRRYVEAIANSGEAMMCLLNDILDISKIEAGKLELEHNPVDIRRKIEVCLQMFEPIARERGLKLVADVADDVPELLNGDPLRVRQIITNLIGNAVKFTSAGSVTVTARVIEHPDSPPGLRIDIADTGIGIAPDQLEIIFEEFGQADSSTSRQMGGTGLGLTISSRLARMMEGEISVTSTPGEGSTFTFTMPIRELQDRRKEERFEFTELAADGERRPCAR